MKLGPIIVLLLLTGVTSSFALNVGPVVDSSVLLYEQFNNNTSIGDTASLAVDSSQYKNNCTLTLAKYNATANGPLNDPSLAVNGSAQYANCGAPSILDQNTTALTITMWVNPSGFTATNPARFLDWQNRYIFYSTLNTGSTLFDTSSLSDNTIPLNTNITPNVWNFLTFTFNGTTKKVYLNGVLKNTETVTFANITSSVSAMFIGGRGFVGNYFSGQIDEVMIQNITLTDAQVANRYNNYVGVECGNNPNGSACNVTQETNWTNINVTFPQGVIVSSSKLTILNSTITFTGAGSLSNTAADTSNIIINGSTIIGNGSAFSITNNANLSVINSTIQRMNNIACTNNGGHFTFLNSIVKDSVSEGLFYNGCSDLNVTNTFFINFSGTGGMRIRNSDRAYISNVTCINGSDTCVNILPSISQITQNHTVISSNASFNSDYGFACKFCNNFWYYNLYVERNVVGYGIDIYGASTNGTVANSTVVNVQGVGIAFSEDNVRLGRNLSSANNTVRNASTCLYYNDVVNFYSDNDKLYDCRQRGFSTASNATNGNITNLYISNATLDSIKIFDSDNITMTNVTVVYPNNTLYIANFRNFTLVNGWNNASFDYQSQVRSGANNTNFSNVSGYSFLIRAYTTGDFNLSSTRAIFNNSDPTTVNISFFGLNNALIFNENGSLGCSNVNLCDGAQNVSIPGNNRSIILDNFNLTEGVNRTLSPISLTGSGNTRTIVSTLADTAQNLTIVINTSGIVPLYPYMILPNGSQQLLNWTYDNTTNIMQSTTSIFVGNASIVLQSINVTGSGNTRSINSSFQGNQTVTLNISTDGIIPSSPLLTYPNGSSENPSYSYDNTTNTTQIVVPSLPPGVTNLTVSTTCGDGFVTGSEQCDSPGLSGACPAACSATCVLNVCNVGTTAGGGGGGSGAGATSGAGNVSNASNGTVPSAVLHASPSVTAVLNTSTGSLSLTIDRDLYGPGDVLTGVVVIRDNSTMPGTLSYQLIDPRGNKYPAATVTVPVGSSTKLINATLSLAALPGTWTLQAVLSHEGQSPVTISADFTVKSLLPVTAGSLVIIVVIAVVLLLLVVVSVVVVRSVSKRGSSGGSPRMVRRKDPWE